MADYYLLRDGKTLGPFRAEEIRAWAGTGQLGPADLFCPVGGQQWAPVGQWPELSAAPPAAATPSLSTGLAAWVTRGWQMVSTDAGPFVLGALLVMALSLVTLGICGPPLSAGLYAMALRKHDGRPVQAGDVMEGFKYFGATWGLALLVGVPVAIVIGALAAAAVVLAHGKVEDAMPMIQLALQLPANALGLFIGTVLLFAIPLIVDRGVGSIQALQESWAAVKPQFWSYLGAYFIFQMISGAGAMACGIGVLFTMPLSIGCIIACYRTRFPAKG